MPNESVSNIDSPECLKTEGHVMRTLAGERSARLFKEIEESREGCSRKRGS